MVSPFSLPPTVCKGLPLLHIFTNNDDDVSHPNVMMIIIILTSVMYYLI